MSIAVVHDAIHANIGHLPLGQAAGYTTGSPDIRWTGTDWAHHPGAVRICQDIDASDVSADVLDVESGAATNAEAAHWYQMAARVYAAIGRPGQRHPAIYTSAANVTPLVNALIAAGVKSGPALWVANWNLSDPQAVAEVIAASGPYPVIGVQFFSGQFYDTSVFSSAWLAGVSKVRPPGAHRHLTDGRSLAQIAASRHTTVAHLWSMITAHYTAADVALLADTPTKDVPYYTTNP